MSEGWSDKTTQFGTLALNEAKAFAGRRARLISFSTAWSYWDKSTGQFVFVVYLMVVIMQLRARIRLILQRKCGSMGWRAVLLGLDRAVPPK